MLKTITAVFLFIILLFSSSQTFAFFPKLQCHFTDRFIEGVESITFVEDKLIINGTDEITLDLSEINCSNFGRQVRLDGRDHGYQVILKSCTSEGVLEGRLIDNIKQEIGDIICLEEKE